MRRSSSNKPRRWAELSDQQKKKVEQYIDLLLAEQLPLVVKIHREVVEQKQVGSISYQLELVKCGKATCTKCPHGPYWYGYYRRGKRMVSKYVGKDFKLLDKSSYVSNQDDSEGL